MPQKNTSPQNAKNDQCQHGSYTDECVQNTDIHGSNMQSTWRPQEQSWHSDGLTGTNKAETQTAPDKHDVYTDLHSSYTAATRTTTYVSISLDRQGSFELPETAVLASRSIKDIPRRSRTIRNRHGATWRLHESHT